MDRRGLAQTIAAHVAGVPGVACLSAGRGVEAATYYPGGKIAGVVIRDGAVDVHVVISVLPIGDVVERVRHAAALVLADVGHTGRRVDVMVEDIALADLPARA